LNELVEQLRESGRHVAVLAPQRRQVVDMEKAGLPLPSTVASFLVRRELVPGAVVVVDEAGQIGGRQLLELLRLVRERNARVILSGDTRQHGAVEASDALFAIERYSGVKPVELHKIRRQDPALGRDEDERTRIKCYRKAVEAAAAGKMDESFDRLDKMGWDDPVTKHLPSFQMFDPWVTREITVRDLLSHRSGLGPKAGVSQYSPEEIVFRLRYIKPASSFRST
jgi:ATP-dependent exoDNAse (exonuclease V) alpha subunit